MLTAKFLKYHGMQKFKHQRVLGQKRVLSITVTIGLIFLMNLVKKQRTNIYKIYQNVNNKQICCVNI